MGLKLRVKSLDGVPAEFHSFYAEQNGEYVLQVEGIEDTTGLKNALASEKEERRKAREQLAALKDAIGDMDPQQAREALARIREIEDKQLIDQGKFDELLAKRTEEMKRSYEAQINALKAASDEYQSKLQGTESRLHDYVLSTSIKEAALKLGVRPEALDLLTLNGKTTFKVEGDGLVAVDGSGNVRYGKNGSAPLTVEEWIEGERASRPFLFQESKGGGAAGGSSQRAGRRVVDVTDPGAFGANLEAIAAGDFVRSNG